MIQRILFSFLLLTYSSVVFGQRIEPTPWNGMYIIQKKGQPKTGENIFANPEAMPDRTVLDSSKQMIARKTSFSNGYIYYEWKNKRHKKSFMEIGLDKPKIKVISHYTDSGQSTTNSTIWVLFFVTDNPFDLVEGIRVPETQRASDSLVRMYRVPTDMVSKGKFWTAYNFYESGILKSTGTVFLFSGNDVYQIGKWLYYDGNGQLSHAEEIRHLKKTGR